MVTPLITSINRPYLPGLKALYNSYLANAGEGFEFYCIVDGDDSLFDEVRGLGINAVHLPGWAKDYPTSPAWPEKIKSLYAPLLVPVLFSEYERAIWIDADCVIVAPITGLLDYQFKQPVAACRPNKEIYILEKMAVGCDDAIGKVAGMFGGLYLFNIPEWNRLDVTAKCAEAMTDTSIVFKWAEQSVLSFVVRGNFYEIPMSWQTFAHRKSVNIKRAIILHWLGCLPWRDKVRNRAQWEKYAAKDQ